MTHSDTSAATDSSTPRPRRQWLWPAHATLALVIVVGGVWALGRDEAAAAPPTTGVQQTADHPVAAHDDSQSHAATPNTDDPHVDDAHGEHGANVAPAAPAAHGHDEPEAHSAAETPAHDDETMTDHVEPEAAAGHADTEAAHVAGGHGDEAAPVPASTRQVVLGGFAGVNVLAIVAAGILRRRNPPRLPKHLQR